MAKRRRDNSEYGDAPGIPFENASAVAAPAPRGEQNTAATFARSNPFEGTSTASFSSNTAGPIVFGADSAGTTVTGTTTAGPRGFDGVPCRGTGFHSRRWRRGVMHPSRVSARNTTPANTVFALPQNFVSAGGTEGEHISTTNDDASNDAVLVSDGDHSDDDSCLVDDCSVDEDEEASEEDFKVASGKASADNDVEPTSDDEDAPQCCVCFHSLTTANPAVILPCCGSKESSESTTLFCTGCITKCIKSQNESDSFLQSHLLRALSGGADVGECPRCRSLIAVHSPNFPLPPAHIRLAYIIEAARFAARRPAMRPLLLAIAHVYPHYIPIELLKGDVEGAHMLCRWGILTRVRKDIYAIEPIKQAMLSVYVEDNVTRPEGSSVESLTAEHLFDAASEALLKGKLIVATRLYNQFLVMLLVWFGGAPKCVNRLGNKWQGATLSSLNALLLFMLVRVLAILAKYVFAACSLAKTVGYLLSISPRKEGWHFLNSITQVSFAVLSFVGLFPGKGPFFFYSVIGLFANTYPRHLIHTCKVSSWNRVGWMSICIVWIFYYAHMRYFAASGDVASSVAHEGQCVSLDDEFA